MFEPLSTHQVDKNMSFFAATVSYWSRAPRLQQRWMPQSILVAGGSLCTLISKFAAERLLVGDTPRCTGAVGEQQRRQVWLQASGYSQLGASPRFWRRGAPRKLQHLQRRAPDGKRTVQTSKFTDSTSKGYLPFVRVRLRVLYILQGRRRRPRDPDRVGIQNT